MQFGTEIPRFVSTMMLFSEQCSQNPWWRRFVETAKQTPGFVSIIDPAPWKRTHGGEDMEPMDGVNLERTPSGDELTPRSSN